MGSATSAWLVPVLAIFTLQTTASFVTRLIPIIAPALTKDFGWNSGSVGFLTASHTFGGLAILVLGSALFRSVGGIRVLQVTLLVGAAAMMLFLYPSMSLAVAACFAMGLSNGASYPAGSEVLQRFSPPDNRNLMFSIKQAGVPLGGVVAGLLIPVMVAMAGWRVALLACAVIVVLTTGLTWRFNPTIAPLPAGDPRPLQDSRFRALRALVRPLTSLTSNRALLKMSLVGPLLVVSQSCWFVFTVVYLTDVLGFSLGLAGMVFAVMQTGGVIGRIALGWLSDRFHSAAATLSFVAVISASTTALLALTGPTWPVWAIFLVAFIAGCSVASWNGVQIAEVARLSPPHLVSETAAGSSILVNLTVMLAPIAFSVYVTTTGHYDYAFFCAAVCSILALRLLPRVRFGPRPT